MSGNVDEVVMHGLHDYRRGGLLPNSVVAEHGKISGVDRMSSKSFVESHPCPLPAIEITASPLSSPSVAPAAASLHRWRAP